MEPPRATSRAERRLFGLLAAVGAALVIAYLFAGADRHARSVVADASLALVFGLTALVLLAPGRDRTRSDPRQSIGLFLLFFSLLHTWLLVHELLWPRSIPFGGGDAGDLVFLLPAGLILIAAGQEFAIRFRRDERREVLADVALCAGAVGGAVFLILVSRPEGARAGGVDLSSVVFAAMVIAPVAWGALAAWAPSLTYLWLFVAWSSLAAGIVGFGFQWIRHDYVSGRAPIDLPAGLGAIALAAILAFEARRRGPAGQAGPLFRIKPILTVTAVTSACATLALAETLISAGRTGALESAITVAFLAAAVAVRILLNQLRTTRATKEAARALSEKDATIRETDATLKRLRDVHGSLAASEERLRLLFDAAVDGIVELSPEGMIRRANEAFCSMVQLPHEEVLGRKWEDVASSVSGGGPSLAGLPETGGAVLEREGNEVHLAGRASDLPGPDSGRLLVIRDVSADKIAEMTIRSLFKFLQDRDEDRSRLLRRTNAAIEAERNRIARDLHDGPVQGISAASLSLEAVLLMLRTGDVDGGIDMLAKIREELSQETDNLRRLMSDLRPPVLEERGLIPALRDTLARFGQDFGVVTQFHARALVDVPPDLETLAYRIVQEALTNAAKHSDATEVTVSVEAGAGQLRVEVIDDGKGFEPERAREYLRLGRVGLASMRERTELASGTFIVRSTLGGGTAVTATLPLEILAARRAVSLG